MKLQQELFQESFDFIRQNPEATSDLLPDNLLKNWSLQDESDTDCPFEIFIIAYSVYMIRKTGSNQFEADTDRLNDLFSKFQHILIMEFIRRKLPLEFAPPKIFDFDNYKDEIEVSIKQKDIPFFNEMYNHLKNKLQ